jgi:hypothetical protein
MPLLGITVFGVTFVENGDSLNLDVCDAILIVTICSCELLRQSSTGRSSPAPSRASAIRAGTSCHSTTEDENFVFHREEYRKGAGVSY